MNMREEFKIEVKTAALLVFMGVGAVASGIGCLTGALRTVEDIVSGKVEMWEPDNDELYTGGNR